VNLDWAWIERNLPMIGSLLVEHIVLAVLPVLIAFVVSLPLGFLVHKTKRAANLILAFLGVIYSIPSLALFVMMPLILGTQILNPVNIVVALAIYSTALLVRSVVDGLRVVPPAVRQSATAVGYGWSRRLFKVEFPLAMPVIFAGPPRRHGLEYRSCQRRGSGRKRSARQALRSRFRQLLLHSDHYRVDLDASSVADL
jgi:osmoprotectant transport system permease protein